MTEILIALVGIFAFMTLALSLELGSKHKALLKMAGEIQDLEGEIEHWEEAWEKMYGDYCELSQKFEPKKWFGCDSAVTFPDTDGPDSWVVKHPWGGTNS